MIAQAQLGYYYIFLENIGYLLYSSTVPLVCTIESAAGIGKKTKIEDNAKSRSS